jgi:hypothetical protein
MTFRPTTKRYLMRLIWLWRTRRGKPTSAANLLSVATNDTTQPDAAILQHFAQKYWNGNDQAVRRAVARVAQLRSVLAPILQEEGIPDELAALVLVESGGQPTALSPKGARGIWPFMPETARRFALALPRLLLELGFCFMTGGLPATDQ